MPGTLISLVLLLACPLGMAAMIGIPTIARRVKARRQAANATSEPGKLAAPRST